MASPQPNGNGAAPQGGSVKQPIQGGGTVYQVLSGDTIEVCLGTRQDRMILRRLTLAGVQAPRMGLKTSNMNTADEPFSWDSREFLRKWLLNKQVDC